MASSVPTRACRAQSGSRTNIIVLMAALLCAVFAFQLNASMLSPALHTMSVELNATEVEIGVTQTAFFASAALFSLFLPRWGDLIGRKKILLGMLLATGIGCVVSALAPNVTILGIGRVIQGTAGPMVPLTLVMLHQEVPEPRRYAKYMAILTSVNGGIAGVDALLGGWLAGNWGFRSVFVCMAVVCAVAFLASVFGTRESQGDRTPMDWPGVIALLIVFGCVYFAFNELGKLGDARWWLIGVEILVAAVSAVIFWKIESSRAHPLVATRYLKQRRTWALLSTTLFTMTGVFAVMNGLIPNLAQLEASAGGLELPAETVSFVTLTPYALAGLIMGPITGQLASRFGYKKVLQAGLLSTVIFLGIAVFGVGAPSKSLIFFLCVAIGITYAGTVNIMLNGLGIVLSPADNQGYLPGMNAGAFNLGAGLSFAILTAVATAVGGTENLVGGYQAGIAVGAVLVIIALLLSTLIPSVENAEESAS